MVSVMAGSRSNAPTTLLFQYSVRTGDRSYLYCSLVWLVGVKYDGGAQIISKYR
jgi:hypothetical protein